VIQKYPRHQILDSRGCLEFIEFDSSFPFTPKRVYFLSDVPPGQNRGLHAHKELEQVIICLQGSLDFEVDDSRSQELFHLSSDSDGYYIPPGVWRELRNFAKNTVVMVIASNHFDKDDYIYDLNQFNIWASARLE
jgi:dTDP-4-dehydrorhamnose 3,5-epimerase-like enzyme